MSTSIQKFALCMWTVQEFDAVVGDVTITTARSKLVDFTQPYTTSGLMVVVAMKGDPQGYAWAFLSPFTAAMWLVTCIFSPTHVLRTT